MRWISYHPIEIGKKPENFTSTFDKRLNKLGCCGKEAVPETGNIQIVVWNVNAFLKH